MYIVRIGTFFIFFIIFNGGWSIATYASEKFPASFNDPQEKQKITQYTEDQSYRNLHMPQEIMKREKRNWKMILRCPHLLRTIFFDLWPLKKRLEHRLICTSLVDQTSENEWRHRVQYWIDNSRFDDCYKNIKNILSKNQIMKNYEIFSKPGPIMRASLDEKTLSFLFEKNSTGQFLFLEPSATDKQGMFCSLLYNTQTCHIYDLKKIIENNKKDNVVVRDIYKNLKQANHLIFHTDSLGWKGPYQTIKPKKPVALFPFNTDFYRQKKAYEKQLAWNTLFNLLNKITDPSPIKRVTLCYKSGTKPFAYKKQDNSDLLDNIMQIKEILDKHNIALSLDRDLIKIIQRTKDNESLLDRITTGNITTKPSVHVELMLDTYLRSDKNKFVTDFVSHDFNNFYRSHRKKLGTDATELDIEDEIYRCYVQYVIEQYHRSKNNQPIKDLFRNTFLYGDSENRARNVHLLCSFLLPNVLVLLHSDEDLLWHIIIQIEHICQIISHHQELFTNALVEKPELLYSLWNLAQLPQFDDSRFNIKYYSFINYFFEFNEKLNTDEKTIKVMNQIKKDIAVCMNYRNNDTTYVIHIVKYLLTQTKNSEILYNYGIELLQPLSFFHLLEYFPYEQQDQLYNEKRDEFITFLTTYNQKRSCPCLRFLSTILCYASETICADIFCNEQIKTILQKPQHKECIKWQAKEIRIFLSKINYSYFENYKIDKERKNSTKKCIFKYLSYCPEITTILTSSEFTRKLPSFLMKIQATDEQIDQFTKKDNKEIITSNAANIICDIIELFQNKKDVDNFNTICNVMNKLTQVLFCDSLVNFYNLKKFFTALHDRILYEKSIVDNPVLQNKTTIHNIERVIQRISSWVIVHDNKTFNNQHALGKIKLLLITIPRILSHIAPYSDNRKVQIITNKSEVIKLIQSISEFDLSTFGRIYLSENPSCDIVFDLFCDTLKQSNNKDTNILLRSRVLNSYLNYLAKHTFLDSPEKIRQIIDCIDFPTLQKDAEGLSSLLVKIWNACKTRPLQHLFLDNIIPKISTTVLLSLAKEMKDT